MNPQAYQQWQALHRRIMMGESLTGDEQAAYEARCQALDTEESLDGDLARLRELRAGIITAKAEQERLREREAELDARIADLEARLDQRTRQLLGITP